MLFIGAPSRFLSQLLRVAARLLTQAAGRLEARTQSAARAGASVTSYPLACWEGNDPLAALGTTVKSYGLEDETESLTTSQRTTIYVYDERTAQLLDVRVV